MAVSNKINLLLLPGLHGTGDLFEPLVLSLPEWVNPIVIAYPQLGCQSYKSLYQYVENHLNELDNFVVLAESFSGSIADKIVDGYTEKCQAVIFVATFLQNPSPLLLKLLRFMPIGFIKNYLVFPWMVKQFLLDKQSDAMAKLITKTIKDLPSYIIRTRLANIKQLAAMEVNSSEMPALYIQASKDILLAKSCVNIFRKKYVNMQLVEVVSGHFVLQSHDKKCCQHLVDFLKKTKIF